MRFVAAWCILILLVTAAFADDQSDISKRVPSGHRLLNVRVARPWALLSYQPISPTYGGCTELLHLRQAGWVAVTGGGGAMSAPEIFAFGVPQNLWAKLLKFQPTPQETEQALSSGPMWDQDTRELLFPQELEGLSSWELTLRRNHLFARHGWVFQDKELASYFSQRRWYKPNPAFRLNALSPIELANAKTIAAYQQARNLLD